MKISPIHDIMVFISDNKYNRKIMSMIELWEIEQLVHERIQTQKEAKLKLNPKIKYMSGLGWYCVCDKKPVSKSYYQTPAAAYYYWWHELDNKLVIKDEKKSLLKRIQSFFHN